MRVYILLQMHDVYRNNIYHGTDTTILGVYDNRSKAVKAMYEWDAEDREDGAEYEYDYTITEREVM